MKARIDRLEEAPDADATIAPDQLPPGAAVYDIFPEEERPYLIKVYIARLSDEPETIDSLTKKLAQAKGVAAKEAVQKTLDEIKTWYQLLRSTNVPPYIGSDLNNWGQKVRSNTYSTSKDVEWKLGAVGTFADYVYPVTILDKDSAVVLRKFRKSTESQTLVIEGIDTSKMVVGRMESLGGILDVLWVSEMTTYPAAGGAQKSAPLLERFDWERYKAEREKLKDK